MKSFHEAWADVADVEGWLTEGQAWALYDAATTCPPGGVVVEIGSFHGRSTIVLASGVPDGVVVYAIDPHAGNDRGPQEITGFEAEAADDHERFHANLRAAGVDDRVRHLRSFSEDALADVPASIDVLYVDGAHRYAPARADIRRYGDRVTAGGTMLVHDSFSSIGVTAAILRELLLSGDWVYRGRSRSLAVYERTRGEPRWRNAARQAAQLPWFARNVAWKVALTLGVGRLLNRLGRPEPDWPY